MVLCRLLAQHPHVQVTRLFSRQYAGQKVGVVLPHLFPYADITLEAFDPDGNPDVDILFLALPHGAAHADLPKYRHKVHAVVDLSADFRLQDLDVYAQYYGMPHQSPALVKEAVYGIPELHRDPIRKATLLANPGCYATCVTLGLAPLAKAGWIVGPAIVDAKSGVSGAGRGLKENTLFCEVNEDLVPYGTVNHRHVPEMEAQLGVPVLFSPHLIPMTRGMLASMYITLPAGVGFDQVQAAYQAQYAHEPFVTMLPPEQIHTRYVSGSNHCVIGLKDAGSHLIVFSAIDNLIKGASGQAIQNLNIMMGFPETTGLAALALFL